MAAGLNGLQANLLTELLVGWEPFAYAASRGWSPEATAEGGMAALEARGLVAGGAFTEAGGGRADVEETTDRLVQPVVDALGGDLPALVQTLDVWSRQIVEAGWFPPDLYKRASG